MNPLKTGLEAFRHFLFEAGAFARGMIVDGIPFLFAVIVSLTPMLCTIAVGIYFAVWFKGVVRCLCIP